MILHRFIFKRKEKKRKKKVQHVFIGNKAQKVGGGVEQKETPKSYCKTDSLHDEKRLQHEMRCRILYSQK